MSNYIEWKNFKNIYLEDSYVIDIAEQENAFTFSVEFVLLKSHPLFHPPEPGEAHCYKRGKIIFPNPIEVVWIEKKMHPIVDITEDVDFGNIDTFNFDGSNYHLTGDWGNIMIKSDPPLLQFE